jgi:hypothetical protein
MAKKGKRIRPNSIRKEEDVLERNIVAKYMNKFYKSVILTNKKKYMRNPKHKGNNNYE